MTTLAASIVAAAAAWVVAAVLLDVVGHRPDVPGRFDAIVVAGAAVRADGRPSGALARRVDLAVTLWRRGHASRIVLTGGPGVHGLAEGAVAAAYARAAGVPDEALLVEEVSASTEENAFHAARVCGAGHVVVVTDSYHALRCRRVFARHFAAVEVATVRPPMPIRLRLALREVPVLAVYAYRGWLSPR